MNLAELGLNMFVQPRVLHTIPGRMRLHVPFLRRVAREAPDIVDMAARLLAIPPGITSVSASGVSGNVLFQYDPAVISEQDIHGFLRTLVHACARERRRLLRAVKETPETLEAELGAWLRDALSQRLYLDPTVRIDAYVRD